MKKLEQFNIQQNGRCIQLDVGDATIWFSPGRCQNKGKCVLMIEQDGKIVAGRTPIGTSYEGIQHTFKELL